MGTFDHINRVSLTALATVYSTSIANTGRVLIRVTQDTRFGNDETHLTDSGLYFTMTAGQTLVLDPPNFFNELVYFRLDTASTGAVEIWSMGVK